MKCTLTPAQADAKWMKIKRYHEQRQEERSQEEREREREEFESAELGVCLLQRGQGGR